MPRKVFTAGEVLTAADVNSFLMDQSVMTFADSAARGSAIGTATEGMVSYLNNNNSLEVYDGSAWNTFNPQSGNAIINGAFEINQRGFTSTTSDAAFGMDRWLTRSVGGTTTHSRQTFSPGSAPLSGYESTAFHRIVTTGQSAATDQSRLDQNIEDIRTFAGQQVTFSFFAKAATGTPKIAIEMAQFAGSGGSGGADTFLGQVTLGTTWARYSITGTIPSLTGATIGTGSYLAARLFVSAGSNFNARTGSLGIQSNTFDIWGVQLEAGSVATPFRRNANSIQGELAACQRYYFRASSGSTLAVLAPTAYAQNTTTVIAQVQFPVTMRVAPTSAESGNVRFQNFAGTAFTLGALSLDQPTDSMTGVFATTSGLTAGHIGRLLRDNNVNGFIGFSAEL